MASAQNPRGIFYPPLDGSLYLPDMVQFNAERHPNHPFYVYHDERLGELCHVSHLDYYRACHRVAHAVRPNRHGPDGTIVAIIANSDTVLYQALTMGVIFAGLVPFPMSPRNSPAAVINMLRVTGCRRLLATRHSLASLLDSICAELPELQIDDPPTLAYAYPIEPVPFVPYPKGDTRPDKNDTMLYLHSSGSTGFPKAIPMTFLTGVHWCTLPLIHDLVLLPRHITVCGAPLPPFHMSGVLLQLFYPIAALQTTSVFPPMSYHDPARAPIVPNAQNTIDVIRLTKSSGMLIVPRFLEEWAVSTEAIDVLRTLEYVNFGGGPFAKKTGDVLVAAGVKLSSVYGGTEFGPLTHIYPTERHLWDWIRFRPGQNVRWAPQGDGTYECQLLTCSTHQPSVENLPDVKGYATADVFVKHPTIEGLYRIVGRLDDVLTHSSGEKTVPGPMENVISACPVLSGVCMFGRGRNQTGVLVESRGEHAIDVTDDEQVSDFRNKIWRYVDEANKEGPAFSRIFKEMILVTGRDKPMLRAGKGTVMKKATIQLYEPEIDALYTSVEATLEPDADIPLPLTWSRTEVEDWLAMHATAVNANGPVEVDKDLFEQGFDSLSTTFLRNRIIGSLAASSKQEHRAAATCISQNDIFSNPIIRSLAGHLIQLVNGHSPSSSLTTDPKAEIEDMIAKYSVGLKDIVDRCPALGSETDYAGDVVLLTGSTGGLGSYLLASLLSRQNVVLVYAFNRPSKSGTIEERQHTAFKDRGLDASLLDSERLIHIEGDASQPNLSLDDQTYGKIRDSVTVIVHNAWRLDFNLGLSSFEPNIRGTRHLIDLARTSSRSSMPRFLFASSLGSTQGWDQSKGPCPEEVQMDAGVAIGRGYGSSKYVSERILAASGLATTSFRIGQISGGMPRGAWSTREWIPIIVKSSVALGALPSGRGVVTWLPPDVVSDAMLQVAFADEAPPSVVNLVHPRPVAWASIVQAIGDAVHRKRLTSSPLLLIPFAEWTERLATYAAEHGSEEDMRRVPATKLVEFVRGLAERDASNGIEVGVQARFATEVAHRTGMAVRDLEPLSDTDAERWVDYWESVGMFSE